MNVLMVLNDAPYGSERAYNGLHLAGSLTRREGMQLRMFLIGDAMAAAKSGQKVPSGYYNAQTMLSAVLKHGGVVGVCGSCMDARGITDGELAEGSRRSSLDELTGWTVEAEKVLVF